MNVSRRRVRAIFRKELREYRRNRQIVASMAVLPLVFSIYPIIEIFALPASSAAALAGKEPLVYMLAIPAIVPATVAAYSVAGERQGTLEPVLTTPVRAVEFLLGKALAALVPVLAVSFGVFGAFVAAIELFAQPAVASAVLHGPEVLAQLLFTPLLAAWSIWVGIAISARSSDPRVAAQLSVLASAPRSS
jgi:ABC-2 type transport system permease protein